MKDILEGLFSFKGRMRRSEFWLLLVAMSFVSGGVLLVGSMLVLAVVPRDMASDLGAMHAVAQGVLQLATLWPTLAILTKRGHDRNRPAAFTIGLWLVSLATGLMAEFVPPVVSGVIIIVISLYFLVDYGFIDGVHGYNRYGHSPKGYRKGDDQEALKTAGTFD